MCLSHKNIIKSNNKVKRKHGGSDTIKNFLKYIPGFRTFTIWKMIVAGLYYLMSLSMITSGFGLMLSSLAFPFVVFKLIDFFKKKKNRLPLRNTVISLVVGLLAFFMGSSLTSCTQNPNLQSNNTENTSISSRPSEKTNEAEVSPSPGPTEALSGKQKAKVVKVVDGDTFEIESGKRVRLIGVDTAESVHPDKTRNTAFGKIASSFTREKLEGNIVYLEKDVSETDKYGRLLRYAYLDDGTFYNEYLVREGMARPATFPPDVKYAVVFVKAEQYVRDNNKGLWAADGQKPQGTPTPKPTSKPTPTPTPRENQGTNSSGGGKQYVDENGRGLIKGNINSKGEKIYHLPGGQFYNRTIAEEWFKTENDARAAGYRKSQR